MKLARIALAAAAVLALPACGGKGGAPTSPEAVVGGLPATRWVPARPTYLVAAPSLREAQQGLRSALDAIGLTAGVDAAALGALSAQVLGVDLLDARAVAAIGIDLEASIAMFSEAMAPTIVVKVNAPDALAAFFDRQRSAGLVTRSVMVDGAELFTARISGDLDVSWVVSDGWLWLHPTPSFERGMGTQWFSSSHAPSRPGWSETWTWADQRARAGGAAASLVGFIDPKGLLAGLAEKVPAAAACVSALSPLQRIALSVGIEGTTVSGQLAFDLGAQAQAIDAATLGIPEGFPVLGAQAPLAAQWNLDLAVTQAYLRPCLALAGGVPDITSYGVRAGRAILRSLDPDDKSGEGVVSLDLSSKRWIASLLDEVPMRSTLESSRKFGPLAGYRIKVPFVATVDYVLTDKVAYAAMGDRMIETMAGRGTTIRGPVAALDVVPGRLSQDAWALIFDALGASEGAHLAQQVLKWRDAHVLITVDGSSLVVAARGTHL